mgnify:CR=1 FL=1
MGAVRPDPFSLLEDPRQGGVEGSKHMELQHVSGRKCYLKFAVNTPIY